MTGHKPWRDLRAARDPQMSMVIAGDRNATVAALTLRRPWRTGTGKGLRSCVRAVYVTGSAKREKGDPYEREIGTAFALARALRALADALEREAWARVRSLENKAAAEHARHQKAVTRASTPRRLLSAAEIREEYGPEAAALHEQRQRDKVARAAARAAGGGKK